MNADESCYEGNFKDDRYHGFGKLKQIDKHYYAEYNEEMQDIGYVGEYEDGLKHGKGKETQSEEIYEGDFVRGVRQGFGNLETIW